MHITKITIYPSPDTTYTENGTVPTKSVARIAYDAIACANSLAPGQRFKGAYSEAEALGYVKGSAACNLFVALFLSSMEKWDIYVDDDFVITSIVKP